MSKAKTIKPLEAYGSLSDPDVVSRGTAVVTNMTGNLNFSTPPVDLTVLKAGIDKLSALNAEALDGSKKVIAEKNKQREAVIKMLRLLGRYVEVSCHDDMAIFKSSGFEPASRTPAPPQPLPTPVIKNIDHGAISGQLLVQVKAIRKARSYELRCGASANGGAPATWTTMVLTHVQTGITVSGLTPGTIYAFQVRALGKLGYTDWSDSATLMCT